jgi:F-box protein 42
MYVFGGCTSSCSTFNDLWRLDLTRRVWVRPLTMGTYPSPKACASLVCYKESLVLFGGWSHPSPYPLHQVISDLLYFNVKRANAVLKL